MQNTTFISYSSLLLSVSSSSVTSWIQDIVLNKAVIEQVSIKSVLGNILAQEVAQFNFVPCKRVLLGQFSTYCLLSLSTFVLTLWRKVNNIFLLTFLTIHDYLTILSLAEDSLPLLHSSSCEVPSLDFLCIFLVSFSNIFWNLQKLCFLRSNNSLKMYVFCDSYIFLQHSCQKNL